MVLILAFFSSPEQEEDNNSSDNNDNKDFTLAEQYSEHCDSVSRHLD